MTGTPVNTRTPLSPASRHITGLVLAAGGSKRLGQPKQLLPWGEVPLLKHVLDTARVCGFDQLLCVIGGAAPAVRERVDFEGVTVVENQQFGEGCSSSIAAALGAVHERSEGLVLMLGDQPGVLPSTVRALVVAALEGGSGSSGRGAPAALAACAYSDGRGHPLLFGRSMFGELATLHGDKGVWKLLDRHADQVLDVPIDRPIPLDVDTWEDFEAALQER